MQDWAIMVIAIVGITTIGGVANRRLKMRAEAGGHASPELVQRIEALEHLEERVRALEAIVTDPQHELAREIRDLEHGRGSPGA